MTAILLSDLQADARGLSLSAFCERHGHAFLVRSSGSAPLNAPQKPLEKTRGTTTPAPASMLSSSQKDTASGVSPVQSEIELMIFPVRKSLRSLSERKITIGRTNNNDVVIEDQSISKLHAFVMQERDTFTVRDAGSSTGTKVNGEAVTKSPAELDSGDDVRFGDVEFTFLSAAALVEFIARTTKPPRK